MFTIFYIVSSLLSTRQKNAKYFASMSSVCVIPEKGVLFIILSVSVYFFKCEKEAENTKEILNSWVENERTDNVMKIKRKTIKRQQTVNKHNIER